MNNLNLFIWKHSRTLIKISAAVLIYGVMGVLEDITRSQEGAKILDGVLNNKDENDGYYYSRDFTGNEKFYKVSVDNISKSEFLEFAKMRKEG